MLAEVAASETQGIPRASIRAAGNMERNGASGRRFPAANGRLLALCSADQPGSGGGLRADGCGSRRCPLASSEQVCGSPELTMCSDLHVTFLSGWAPWKMMAPQAEWLADGQAAGFQAPEHAAGQGDGRQAGATGGCDHHRSRDHLFSFAFCLPMQVRGAERFQLELDDTSWCAPISLPPRPPLPLPAAAPPLTCGVLVWCLDLDLDLHV